MNRTINYELKSLLPLAFKEPPYQFGTFIFKYAACYSGFWMGNFLV